MSLTKRSPHFDEMMEEQRREDDLFYQRYREEMYLNKCSGVPPRKASGSGSPSNPSPNKAQGFPSDR